MIYSLFIGLAVLIPWALPRLFPKGYATAGVALCATGFIWLFVVAGERDVIHQQIAAMGIVVGASIACFRYVRTKYA